MLLVARVSLLLVFMAGAAFAGEPLDPSSYAIGACGGVMTGYNGQSYSCDRDRKAICENATKRCVCLERTDCGGARDEPF